MTTPVAQPAPQPPFDDALVDRFLDREDDYHFDCKRIKKDLTKLLVTGKGVGSRFERKGIAEQSAAADRRPRRLFAA
jgi:hypothetical protein